MKDAPGETAQGSTNWRRFAVAVGVPTAVAGAIVFGIANGALAASFTVSGQLFKISADKLEGTGFAQYGGIDASKTDSKPVAVSAIQSAKLYNLCQSVVMPVGNISLIIRAGTDQNKPAQASNLLIGVDHLQGDATFKNIDIGVDSSTLKKGGDNAHGFSGWFGQEADSVNIVGLKQEAYSTTAGTFTLNNLDLKVNVPGSDGKAKECY